MVDRLASFGHVRAIDADGRRVTTVVSTDEIALDGAIIDQGGWEFGRYDRNPVVLWAHDARSLPIARTVDHQLTQKELIQTHEFATHAQAEAVFNAVRDGFVNATSVRWNPVSWEWRKLDNREVLAFTRQELLEVSYVPVPADSGAVVIRSDGSPLDIDSFRPQPDPRELAQQEQTAKLARLADTLERAQMSLTR